MPKAGETPWEAACEHYMHEVATASAPGRALPGIHEIFKAGWDAAIAHCAEIVPAIRRIEAADKRD